MPLRSRRGRGNGTEKIDEDGVFKSVLSDEAPAASAPAPDSPATRPGDSTYYQALLGNADAPPSGGTRAERATAEPASTRPPGVAQVGKSTRIKGELSGDEDLEIEGTVEGSVKVPDHKITVGKGGSVTADVDGKAVVVIGTIDGSVNATDRVEVLEGGIVKGDIRTVHLVVQDGATINGSVSMGSANAGPARAPQKVEPKGDTEDAGVA